MLQGTVQIWCVDPICLALPLGQYPLGTLPDKDTHQQKNVRKSKRGFGSPLPSTGPNRTHAHPSLGLVSGLFRPEAYIQSGAL
jgi:hypothetical protein